VPTDSGRLSTSRSTLPSPTRGVHVLSLLKHPSPNKSSARSSRQLSVHPVCSCRCVFPLLVVFLLLLLFSPLLVLPLPFWLSSPKGICFCSCRCLFLSLFVFAVILGPRYRQPPIPLAPFPRCSDFSPHRSDPAARANKSRANKSLAVPNPPCYTTDPIKREEGGHFHLHLL
jgi:hypothetical protein